MRLDDARAEFRARAPFEAVDFGAHALRAHAVPLARALAVFSLAPTLAAVLALLAAGETGWAIALVFWIRPLDARIALLVSSRALFGEAPSLRETGRLLLAEGRRRLLWDLTLGRLSPLRAVTLPIAILEGVTGRRRAERVALVARGQLGVMAAAAAGSLALELMLAGSLVQLVEQAGQLRQLVGPRAPEAASLFDGTGASWAAFVRRFALFYALVAPLGEALYALSGFSLYLNRRTVAEGWDVELAFRRLASRLGAAAALMIGLGLAGAARADDTGTADYDRARDAVEAVLARPEFGEEIVEETYRLRFQPKGGEPGEALDLSLMAELVEVFAWLAVGAIAAAAALILARTLPFFARPDAPSRPSSRRATVTRAPPELAPPPGTLADARRLAGEGRALEALSALYGGSVEALSLRFALALAGDATEGECLRAVRTGAPPDAAARFATVTRAWQLAAYRGQAPGAAELARLFDAAAPLFEEAA